jgi:predicted aldo/keto reductase-like oxidoreductase
MSDESNESRGRRRAERRQRSGRLTRRAFLSGAAAVGGAFAAGGLSERAGEAPAAAAAGMRYRTLGRTGLRVSEIGFGAAPLSDPDVVLYALDRGINYIDTSQCYRGGGSEEAIGQALRGRRDRFVVTTKWCPHHSGLPPRKQVFLDMLDQSLRRLGTDHVDVLLNHEVGRNSDGMGIARLQNPEMLAAWETAKKAGKARFLGVSGHDGDLMEVMQYAINAGPFDVILGRYSFLDYPEQQALIERAAAKGVAFIAMKTLAGARGADLDRFRDRQTTFKQAALKWVLSNRRLSNLVISISSRRQVDEYAPASGQALSAADHDVLAEYAALFSTEVCRFCNACESACPGDVRIADVLRFSMYHHEYGEPERAAEHYARLLSAERAEHCSSCAGYCASACAYDLPVKTLLLRAHAALGPGGTA